MLDSVRAYSLRTLVIITLFMVMLTILVDAGLYWVIKQLLVAMSPDSNLRLVIPGFDIEIMIQSLSDITKNLNLLSDNFFVWVVPVTAMFFMMSSILLWFVIKISVSSIFSSSICLPETSISKSSKNRSESDVVKVGQREDKKDHADRRIEQDRQRRLFLHFLSVLQREGRILDFFSEDLTLYDDEQIGAAVRSIQEECKRTVEKYLSPVPVLNKEEGDLVNIEAGFDPDSIKLTGNVSGQPPFKGILRHRGWRAGKKDVPKLSDVIDSSIITPAEVEIE